MSPNFIKDDDLTIYKLAWIAAHNPTNEAADLARRWRSLHTRYANLSHRYHALTKHIAQLHIEPLEIERRYDALDAEFDALETEIRTLHVELLAWNEKARPDV